MIRTAMQLKAKVRNISGGDSQKAQAIIRLYVMEHFLERLAVSRYCDQFILKGGMLLTWVTGINTRTTMDIDTTIRTVKLTKENAERIISDIAETDIPDGIHFHMIKTAEIMEDHDYPGVRVIMEAKMDQLTQRIKIDISAGDIVTPRAEKRICKLIFEDRTISLWTYNLETLIAEKLETILSRGTANTRMRDYYDVCLVYRNESLNSDILKRAYMMTCKNRKADSHARDYNTILQTVEENEEMRHMWDNYKI